MCTFCYLAYLRTLTGAKYRNNFALTLSLSIKVMILILLYTDKNHGVAVSISMRQSLT